MNYFKRDPQLNNSTCKQVITITWKKTLVRNYEVIAYFGLHVYTCFILDISIVIILTLFNKELFFMLIYLVMVVKKVPNSKMQLPNAK